MKLSLAWLLEHIQEKLTIQTAPTEFLSSLADRLSVQAVEIEGYERVTLDLDQFTLARFVARQGDMVTWVSPELKKEFVLPALAGTARTGKATDTTAYCLLIKEGKTYRYATYADIHSPKEGLFPELWCPEEEASGGWKSKVDTTDYLLTIDNKAITHRADLWGHRGFAREVAALFSLTLLPEERLHDPLPIKHFIDRSRITKEMPYEVVIDGKLCNRLALGKVSVSELYASVPWMAIRLARVDVRPYNVLVDATNYVMYDIGQPMHAFDATHVEGGLLQARPAKAGESLTLLDGQTITLTTEDCVIADAQKPLALAGVMGGSHSGVSETTRTVLIEAAHFSADAIRATALRYKHRTEASARFEKNLDPHQNTLALARFLFLLDRLSVSHEGLSEIISVGPLVAEPQITMTHQFLAERLGKEITPERVEALLKKFGFGVTLSHKQGCVYTISVPLYRGMRDVTCAADIVEEIARIEGYDSFVRHLPTRVMRPFSLKVPLTTRAIKHHCAFGLGMHEVNNYALYHEEALRAISYEPTDTIVVKNPVSEQQRRMVTSLVPHLMLNVRENIADHEIIRLFELNKVFSLKSDGQVREAKSLGLIFFRYKSSFDFYAGKAAVQSLFDELSLLVTWEKPTESVEPWYLPEQTARLVHEGNVIGYAGTLSPSLVRSIGEGEGFVVELDADYLCSYVAPRPQYHPVSKYQSVDLDMSLLIPRSVTVDAVKQALAQADGRIIAVMLRDFFEKETWPDQRSITLRFTMSDMSKTLSKEDIDEVWESAGKAVKALGAQIR